MEIRSNTTEIAESIREQYNYLKDRWLLKNRPDELVYGSVSNWGGFGDGYHRLAMTRKEWDDHKHRVFTLQCDCKECHTLSASWETGPRKGLRKVYKDGTEVPIPRKHIRR